MGAAGVSERRQLTVMFCDLVGSTELSLALDAEDFANAVRIYRDACVRIVRAWHGYVSRYVGDGVLVYFGYPVAAEDDAWRAVVAALELARSIPALRLPRLSSGPGAPPVLRVRVSVHTGLTVVGDVVGQVTVELDGALGAVPNIAARLQSLGGPGEVVISEATAALLPPSIPLVPLPEANPGSLRGGVRAFVVKDVPVPSASRRPMSESALLGRGELLKRLANLLAAASPTACGVALVGEAGLGKSRIVQELVRHQAGKALRWIPLACSAYGQISPLHPFKGWLEDLEADIDCLATAEAPAPPFAIADGQVSRDALTPYTRRRHLFERLRSGLMAGGGRIGLVVEDLHWADSMTLEFLAELLLGAYAPGLFVLLTSRQAMPAPLDTVAVLEAEALDRLEPGVASELARALCGPHPLSAYEVAEIVEHADGVPLYIEEFARAIVSQTAGDDRIPSTLRDALMGVLDRLGNGRRVALCASVFGRRFEYRHLQALLELDDAVLDPAVDTLVQARILVQTGHRPEATLEFRHALLRDTAYHTLLKSERQRWHSRLAELAAEGRLPIEESMPEVLALHHSLGGNYSGAITYWMRAQRRAMTRSASVEALAHLRRALEDCSQLATQDRTAAERTELTLLRQLTAPLIAISGWSTPELENVYARAMTLCRRVGSVDIEFELERGLCNMFLLRSELRRADTLADRLMAIAGDAGPPERRRRLLLMALRSKALTAFYGGDVATSRNLLEELLQLHDPVRDAGHAFQTGTHPTMLAHSYLAWMDAAQGDGARARVRIAAALSDARDEGHLFSICYALCFAASCEQMSGDAEAARRHAIEALELGNQHNFAYWISWAQAVLGWVEGLQDPAHGLARVAAARTSYLATGSRLVAPYFDVLACSIVAATGASIADRESALRADADGSGVWFWLRTLAPTV